MKGSIVAARDFIDRSIGSIALSFVRASAADVTVDVTNGSLLVFAPHPDDETLGCGATIARALDARQEVMVVVASDGRHGRADAVPERLAELRHDELTRAAAELGLRPEQVSELGFEDARLRHQEVALSDLVARIIESCKPAVVLTPWVFDPHDDHGALSRSVRQATAAIDCRVFEYIIWGWWQPSGAMRRAYQSNLRRWWCRNASIGLRFRPVKVQTGEFLTRKRAALACHQSQLAPSAARLGLPTADGPLGASFLRRFLLSEEVFLETSGGSINSARIPW